MEKTLVSKIVRANVYAQFDMNTKKGRKDYERWKLIVDELKQIRDRNSEPKKMLNMTYNTSPILGRSLTTNLRQP